MADYCTLAQARVELAKVGVATIDDAAISERILRVTALINNYCGHSFNDETILSELRSGDAVLLTPDGELIVSVRKGNCRSVQACSVSSDFVSWDGLDTTAMYIDQSGPVAYVAHFVQPNVGALGGRGARGNRVYARISYVGGFSPIPDDLVGIASRWTAFLFMKRQAPFEITAFPNVGQVSIPSAIPGDIVQNLIPYKRVRP